MNEEEINKKCLDIQDLKQLIDVLQHYYEKYGNIPVFMNANDEDFDIHAVLWGTYEDGESFISLINW